MKTWTVHRVPLESTQTPTPKLVKLPTMLALCPPLPAKELKIDPVEPPLPTFSPAAAHGGTRLPMLECLSLLESAIDLAQSRALAFSEPFELRPASPLDERRELIRLRKSAS